MLEVLGARSARNPWGKKRAKFCGQQSHEIADFFRVTIDEVRERGATRSLAIKITHDYGRFARKLQFARIVSRFSRTVTVLARGLKNADNVVFFARLVSSVQRTNLTHLSFWSEN